MYCVLLVLCSVYWGLASCDSVGGGGGGGGGGCTEQ